MEDIRSGYILAGFETITGVMDHFIKNTKGRYNDHFTREDLAKVLGSLGSGYLHSYGENFSNKKKYHKYNKQEADVYNLAKDYGIFDDNSTLITDSGGFQIAVGRLDRRESKLLFQMYYEFLEEYHHLIDKAFILDVPPGDNCEVLSCFNDLYDWNYRSYTKAADLPDEIRKKMIYIHHFRTPRLYDIFEGLLRDNDFYSRFDNFGTGGIVASMSGDNQIPCIIYTIPLVAMLNETIKHKKKHLNFHILGGANFRDILFYELFTIHVKAIHDIDLNLTYDSAGIYKGLMRGRFLNVVHEDKVIKMDLRSHTLDQRFCYGMTRRQKYLETINNMARRHGLKELESDKIYNDETNTFYEEIRVYSMLYCLDIYSVVQQNMKKIVKDIYPLYTDGHLPEFNEHIHTITQNLNSGKTTRKQTAKANSVIRSLDMLTTLDEDYCKYVVKKCLAKDEFTNLETTGRILTV